MPNNCLSVLYKHIIQVENKNVGLKVWGGGAQTYHCPPPASYTSDYVGRTALMHVAVSLTDIRYWDKIPHMNVNIQTLPWPAGSSDLNPTD